MEKHKFDETSKNKNKKEKHFKKSTDNKFIKKFPAFLNIYLM